MDDRLRLTIPIEEIDSRAVKQINATLEFPFLKALAIMPDVPSGYDLPIGGVALLDDHIWPGAVGYDIGCGMCHINTGKTIDALPDMEEGFLHKITNYRGFSHPLSGLNRISAFF